MGTLLGMFAKHWTPGRVKTRLAAEIGKQPAAEVHRLFVTALLQRFSGLADERVLAFDPPECRSDFQQEAGAAWQPLSQGSGDLGQRMEAFFAAGLARAKHVVLIGSDSPDLPANCIAEAFEHLIDAEVVLGPAADGGYYLVGAAGSIPPIFSDMPWSTAELWPQTVRRLIEAGCRWHALPQWYDVDTAIDLTQLRMRLRRCQGNDLRLVSLADELTSLLGDAPG